MLNIEIDNGSGFCFGVTTAIQKAEEELAKGSPLYCLGDIVHNGMECERLRAMGLITINHDDLLSLQLIWVGPIVVAFAFCEILASCLGVNEGAPDSRFFGMLIFRLQNRRDEVRVFFGVLFDDISCSIGRCVIVDDDFDGKVDFLHEKALYRLRNIVLLVICRAKN